MLLQTIRSQCAHSLREIVRTTKVVAEARSSAHDWAVLTNERWLSAYWELLRLGLYRKLNMTEAIASGALLTPKEMRFEFVSWEYLSRYRGNTCSREDELFLSDKIGLAEFYQRNNINAVPTIAVIGDKENRHLQNASVEMISWDQIGAWCQTPTGTDILIKPIDGVSGKSVFVFEKGIWRDRKGVCISATEVANAILKYAPKHAISGFLVQPLLHNHPELTQVIGHERLCSVRITTIKTNEDIIILRPIIKITTANNYIDNFSSGTNQNLIAPVDYETGRIGVPIGGYIGENKNYVLLESVEKLPGVWPNPAGAFVPLWVEVKAFVKRAASLHQDVGSIGWDIGITKDGPVVLEANPAWAVDLIQAAYRRGIFSEIQKLIPRELLG